MPELSARKRKVSSLKMKRAISILFDKTLKYDVAEKRLARIFGSNYLKHGEFYPEEIIGILHSGSQLKEANKYFLEGGLKSFSFLTFSPFYAKCPGLMYDGVVEDRIEDVVERFNLVPRKQNFISKFGHDGVNYIYQNIPNIVEVKDLFQVPSQGEFKSIFILDSDTFSVWLESNQIEFRFPFDLSSLDIPRASLVYNHLCQRLSSEETGTRRSSADEGIQKLL